MGRRTDRADRDRSFFRAFDRLAQWWWRPVNGRSFCRIRGVLSLLTAGYFLEAFSDLPIWFGETGLHSSARVGQFLRSAGLEQEAAASISPLFLVDSYGIYYLYVVLAATVCLVIAGIDLFPKFRLAAADRPAVQRVMPALPWAIWLLVIAWANRLMWLSGVPDTLLSWSWFAVAIAGSRGSRMSTVDHGATEVANDYSGCSAMVGFGTRLLALQGSVLLLVTCISMLAAATWWNGTGAIALSTPAENRTVYLMPFLQPVWAHEWLTHAIVVAVPLGLFLAWRTTRTSRRVGVGILIAWAVVVALLGSHWLYGGLIGLAVYSIDVVSRDDPGDESPGRVGPNDTAPNESAG